MNESSTLGFRCDVTKMAFVLFNEEAKIGRDSHRSTSLISVGSSTCGPNNQQSRKKRQNRLNQRREKNQNSRSETEAGDGIEIRPAPSADRFRSSSPLTAADRGRRNRSEQARSPSRTGGTVDPRAEGSALPAVPDGGLGEVHGGEPAREEVEVACWSEEGEAFSSEFQMGSSEMFTFLLFSLSFPKLKTDQTRTRTYIHV